MTQKLLIPQALLQAAGWRLGSRVAQTTVITGGYTPQQLRRLELEDGRKVILKAGPPPEVASPPDWTAVLGKEVAAYRDLPQLAPWRPAYLGDVQADGWIGLLLEDLSGAGRVPPWKPETVEAVASGLAALHLATAGSPRPRGVDSHEVWAPYFTRIRERGSTLGRLSSGWGEGPWREWLQAACAVGDEALERYRSDSVLRCLIHCDVRSDNLFIRRGEMILVDWSVPIWDSPAVDSAYWALGVEMEGGVDAAEAYSLYRRHGPDPSVEGHRGAVALLAGYLLDRLQGSSSPPHVAELQIRFLPHALNWFAREFEIPLPLPAPT